MGLGRRFAQILDGMLMKWHSHLLISILDRIGLLPLVAVISVVGILKGCVFA